MIIISPYQPIWKKAFEELSAVYTKQLNATAYDIQHVGSTSVPGLCAKPVLDIDIIVPDADASKQAIEALQKLGYNHVGDLGIPQREAFRRSNESVPYTDANKQWQKHNLYVCIAGCTSVQNHLQLRDYLLANPDAVTQYSELKKQLAAKYPTDIDSYVDGKTAFITAILKKVGFEDEALKGIEEQNRAK